MINPFANFGQTMQQFNQFKNTLQGDPQKMVQQMLDSGKITQDQLNQVMPIAQQFYQMMNGHVRGGNG